VPRPAAGPYAVLLGMASLQVNSVEALVKRCTLPMLAGRTCPRGASCRWSHGRSTWWCSWASATTAYATWRRSSQSQPGGERRHRDRADLRANQGAAGPGLQFPKGLSSWSAHSPQQSHR
jgi:hypothetical protein